MTGSQNKKLYPLFVRTSKPSAAVDNDASPDDGSDGEEGEDNLPLTSLLKRSKRKGPPKGKNCFTIMSKKKLRKPLKSKVLNNPHFEKIENSFSADCKEEKLKKIVGKLATTSDANKKCKKKAPHEVLKNESEISSSITKCKTFNKLGLNENSSYDTFFFNCEEKISARTTSRLITVKNNDSVPRRCRLYSDAAIDFIPYQSPEEFHAPKSCNIISKLDRRIANGGCLSHHSRCRRYSHISKARVIQNKEFSVPSLYRRPKNWRIPSWLSLEQPATGTIDHIAWDPTGVLLAVVVDRAIIIYDWDMLRAADVQGRSDRARNCRDSKFVIPPVVEFRIQHQVESLVWNPFQIDELAVGFRVTGETIIYNVDQIGRWISKNPSRNNRRPPPQATYKRIVLQRVTGSVSGIMFLDIQNIVVSVGRVLYRWKLPPSNKKKVRQLQPKLHQKSMAVGNLVWRYQPPSHVTSMARLGSNLIVAGTNHGHMCLINWTKQITVTLSFSHEHRPKVLQIWIPHDSLAAPNEDKALRNRMGIMKLRVETSNQECVVGKRHWGRCLVKWVTRSGWLLSTILESTRIHDNCNINYSSPRVVFKNADGSIINGESKSWSLPYSRIGADFPSQGQICFIGVPSVTKVLSHHDKFVLDSQPNTILSKKIIMMVDGNDDGIQKIPLPGVVRHLPQTLAVHPTFEWIVIGECKRLYVMVNSRRGNIKLQCT
mmetsp:Transcript_24210/g.57044  ORF Transcript_24210/g.57044 Transcript_24210/m.57044 type:complete len:714 (-) Transcript_24210:1348-3489(-)